MMKIGTRDGVGLHANRELIVNSTEVSKTKTAHRLTAVCAT
jgi:hypothetical protein